MFLQGRLVNWEDLKVFLAVARRKKLASAAMELKLDITTVSRRIKRLEDSLGQTLFERLRTGHALTSHGNDILIYAEQIESGFEKIGSSKLSAPNTPSGTIRISVAEGFGGELLAPIIGHFKVRFPDIEIDLVSGSGFLSLAKREADVAIGLTRPKSKHIVSELLRTYKLHLYAHCNYLNGLPTIRTISDLGGHTLIDYVDDLIYSDKLRYFEEYLPGHRPTIRSTSIMAQRNLVENGAGIAILPDFLAPDKFVKVLPNQIEIDRQFWFSCHQSVVPLGKIKAFKSFTYSNLAN